MRTIGIVSEFNPFHNGHAYLIATARERFGPARVVCAMSGNFVQRGEPALAEKWARALMAVSCGADLVCEIPTAFACRSAEVFARAGVEVLLKCRADTLVFGCESENLAAMQAVADALGNESPAYQAELQTQLAAGAGFAKAREIALNKTCPMALELDLTQPGIILGIEYVKAVRYFHASLEVVPIPRAGAAHRAASPVGDVASATALRADAALREHCMPEKAYRILQRTKLHEPSDRAFWTERVYSADPDTVRQTPECGEGLENALKKATETAQTWDEIVSALTSKRISSARARRLLMQAALGLTCEETSVPYLKVLAMNESGQHVLREISEETIVITNPGAQLHAIEKQCAHAAAMLRRESAWTDLYERSVKQSLYRRGRELRERVLVVRSENVPDTENCMKNSSFKA